MGHWSVRKGGSAGRFVPSRLEGRTRPLGDQRLLTDAEVRHARLLLCQDMVHLLIEDGEDLPRAMQQELHQLYETLGGLRRQARALP